MSNVMVYVWVRSTVDWEDEQAFRMQLKPAFKPKVDVWNATFDMPYHRFRHELRRIAAANLSRIENAVVASWDEIPDGALVAPVDDDDWFAPDLASVLEQEHDRRVDGYYWVSSFIEVPIDQGFWHRLGVMRRTLFPRTPPRWICTTNNYAIVKFPEMKDLFLKHTMASVWVTSGEARVKRIEKRLSLMNRSLASMTSLRFLRSATDRSRLIQNFHQYKRLYAAQRAHELTWCRPYVAMMADLMDQLHLRR